MYNRLYQPNMCIKFLINRIKIDRVIALTLVAKNCSKNCSKICSKNFPTDCYGEKNRYEWRPSGFMKKMNGGLYRVSRFARDKYIYFSTFWNFPNNTHIFGI